MIIVKWIIDVGHVLKNIREGVFFLMKITSCNRFHWRTRAEPHPQAPRSNFLKTGPLRHWEDRYQTFSLMLVELRRKKVLSKSFSNYNSPIKFNVFLKFDFPKIMNRNIELNWCLFLGVKYHVRVSTIYSP